MSHHPCLCCIGHTASTATGVQHGVHSGMHGTAPLLGGCIQELCSRALQEWSQKQAQRAAVRARAKSGGRSAGDRRFLEPEVP